MYWQDSDKTHWPHEPTWWGASADSTMLRGAPCLYCRRNIFNGIMSWGQVNPVQTNKCFLPGEASAKARRGATCSNSPPITSSMARKYPVWSPQTELTQVPQTESPQEVQGLGMDIPSPQGLSDKETSQLWRGAWRPECPLVKPKTMLVQSIHL